MATPAAPVTAANALFTFYDVESLDDVFTMATYTPRTNTVELFHLLQRDTEVTRLVDSIPAETLRQLVMKSVLAANPALRPVNGVAPQILIHDLRHLDAVERMARLIGVYRGPDVNDPDAQDFFGNRYRPMCDTDPRYDPINQHGYLAGYNSYAYDTTMLALFFHEALNRVFEPITEEEQRQRAFDDQSVSMFRPERFRPLDPKIMRRHNNELFSERYRSFMPSYLTEGEPAHIGGQHMGWDAPASLIRKGMLDSGRHIDVSRLNEAQRMVGLKRLLGGLGRQILESNKLSGHNAHLSSFQDLCELLAYNVADVVGLAKLFEHPTYSSSFDLKKGLLDEYPETIYDQIPGTHSPNISQKSVRMGRLTPDSTSAKFVARILAPYKDLTDIPAVSFMYPSERVAAETGVKRRDVLDECIEFFKQNIDTNTDAGKRAWQEFSTAMDYYKSIRGKNFNDAMGEVEKSLNQVPKTANNIPYYNHDGTPSTCFVTFSTGGIHGAEYDAAAYSAACADIVAFNTRMDEIRAQWPDPLDFWLAHPGKKTYVASDGTEMTRAQALTAGTSKKKLEERRQALQTLSSEEFEERFGKVGYRPNKPMPELFETRPNGSTKLKPQFTYTSAARVIHEDFTSYYPNMLRNMSAFYNPDLGEDRYAKIFEDKERYGREMKRPGISPEEKARLSVLRNGTKLILNSASGAGDTEHRNPIRMNNQIISMRLIGQLFSWRIGQAQTLAGARIVSTNTDGLYSADLDDETNNRVLAEQAAIIKVDIEPEPLWLISKDSNNRLELREPEPGQPLWEAGIVSASGGTLACHAGPQPTKSLAHPAVLDWALARYLREIVGGRTIGGKPLSLNEPMNRDVAAWLMRQARDKLDPLLAARLFQNVLAASVSKLTFPFAIRESEVGERVVRPLQHFNRVFIMRPGTPNTWSIQAAGAWVVSEASRVKRKKDGEQPVTNDPTALHVLEANGYTRDGRNHTTMLPKDQDVAVRRVPRLDPEWSMRIDNRDLVELPRGVIREEILDHLDLDAYVELLASTFEENWMNHPGGASDGEHSEAIGLIESAEAQAA